MTETAIHPFESRGLGQAPFRYVGVEHQEMAHGQRVLGSVGGCEVTTKAGGTCAYCGQYIVNMFVVESADGQRFHVGCDCIDKVDAVQSIKNVSKLAADVKAMKKAREANRIAEAKANLSQAYSLRCEPHPNKWQDDQGKKLWHYAEWLFANGGTAGKLRAARMVELSIARRVDE